MLKYVIQMRPKNIDTTKIAFDLNVESCSYSCIGSGVRYNRQLDSPAPGAATCIIGGRIHHAAECAISTIKPINRTLSKFPASTNRILRTSIV